MIARTWRGFTSAADADPYAEYVRRAAIPPYLGTPGNRGAFIFRRVVEDEVEFLVLSLWDSMDAVRAFAGPDPVRAVFYPEDARYLTRFDQQVEHFEVVEHAVAPATAAGRAGRYAGDDRPGSFPATPPQGAAP
jgi:heme-degrading monooxygenase HmoA